MACKPSCYEATVSSCDDIILKAGLTANTSYYVIIKKPGSTVIHQRQLTSDDDGNITIPMDSFEAGFFNEYAGTFRLEVRAAADYPTVLELTFNEVEYTCVMFTMAKFTEGEEDAETPLNVIQ